MSRVGELHAGASVNGAAATFNAQYLFSGVTRTGLGDYSLALPAGQGIDSDACAVAVTQRGVIAAGTTNLDEPQSRTYQRPQTLATALGTIDENVALASPTTQPNHWTNLQVAFPAGWQGGNVVVAGLGPEGTAASETFVAAPGATVIGVQRFASITTPNGISNTAQAGGGDVATVQIGPSLALPLEGSQLPSVQSVGASNYPSQASRTTFLTPEAPGTAYGTIDENVAGPVAPATQPNCPTNLRVAFPAGWQGGNVTVTGTGADGQAASEIFVAAPGATVNGVVGFASITDLRNSAQAGGGDVATVQAHTGLALPIKGTTQLLAALQIYRQQEAAGVVQPAVAEATVSSDLAEGVVVPTTAKNGGTNYSVGYRKRGAPQAQAAVAFTSDLPNGLVNPTGQPKDGATDYEVSYTGRNVLAQNETKISFVHTSPTAKQVLALVNGVAADIDFDIEIMRLNVA